DGAEGFFELRQSRHCLGVQPGYWSRTSCRRSKDLPQVWQVNIHLLDLLEDRHELRGALPTPDLEHGLAIFRDDTDPPRRDRTGPAD
ncbi:MAG: hypothetical protein ACE1Y9_02205, partial [Acidimicrobiia bacterium]